MNVENTKKTVLKNLTSTLRTPEDFLVLDLTKTILPRLTEVSAKDCINLPKKVLHFLKVNGVTEWNGSVKGYVPKDEAVYGQWLRAVGLDIVPVPWGYEPYTEPETE